MRNVGLSYLLCVLGFFGAAGIHRIYLGKPITGIIYFLTGGLLGIGTIYDLIVMHELVAQANQRALGPGPAALPPHAYGGHGYARPQPHDELKDPSLDLELRLLKLARRHGGRITAALAASELNVSIREADERLSHMASHDQVEVEITDEGVVAYDFPSLRV